MNAVLVVLLFVFSEVEGTALLDCMASQAFARLFPSLFEEGRARLHCTAHVSHGSSSPPLKGWGLMSQTSGLLTLLENVFLECRKISQPTLQTPGSWSLTLGWWCHFHRVSFAPAPTRRRNSNNLRCSSLLFLWWSLSLQGDAGARPCPGRCHWF